MTALHHLRRIGIENALVVGLMIFCEDLMKLRIRCVAIGRAGLLRHLDTAVRHKGSLQRLIGLEADDLFLILRILADVRCAIRCDTGNHLRLHIKHTALGTLLALQALYLIPELVRRLCRALKEACITVIRRIIQLDEIPNIDIRNPVTSLKTVPFLSHILLHSASHRIRLLGQCLHQVNPLRNTASCSASL